LSPRTKQLTELAAYYFAEAITHKKELILIKREEPDFSEHAAIVLLSFLAQDSIKVGEMTVFDKRPSLSTKGSGEMTFVEQYKYYEEQDSKVIAILADHVVRCDIGLERYPHCFSGEATDKHYCFIEGRGSWELRAQWPIIWRMYNLDGHHKK